MSRGINKVILVGRLGNDPEVRYTAAGAPVTTISVATTESWKDRNSGERQERTEWHRVVFFGRLAEIAGQYLTKGSQVYVEGSLRTNRYTDRNGIERFSTEINANELQMLGGGSRGGGGGGGGGYNAPAGNPYDQSPQPQQPPAQGNWGSQNPPAGQPQQQSNNFQSPAQSSEGDDFADFDSFDDDIPF